jgi:metal-responsive CopG/Arc/MetJ family transcriptional regulator
MAGPPNVMKGRSGEVRNLVNGILSLRGVKHGKLVLTTIAKNVP